MSRIDMRVSGFGGQGVILAGYVLGKAAAVMENRHATLTQAFGPEARGSACSAQLVLSGRPISYPYVRQTDILVAMSQDAYRRFVGEVRESGTVLTDESLVVPDPSINVTTLAVPATRIAEKLGRRIMANMVMVGFVTGATGLVGVEAIREAVRGSVPSGTEDVNLNALDQGIECGRALVGNREPEGATS